MTMHKQLFTNTWMTAFLLVVLSLLAGCGGSDGSPDAAVHAVPRMKAQVSVTASDVTVVSLTKISETRISRTVYDYVFQVSFQNNGQSQSGVTAVLVGTGAGTTIVDGTVEVGNMPGSSTVTPTDTVTLRQDRAFAFDVGSLVWKITSAPDPNSASALIGPGGGTLVTPSGIVTLDIPPGALATTTRISISKASIIAPDGNLGPVVDLTPNGQTFTLPVNLKVKYDPAILGEASGQSLRIATIANGVWNDLTTVVDPSTSTLTASLSHFSYYSYKEVSGLCVSSGNSSYDLRLATLAQRIFNKSSPIYSGTFCVDEGYLQDGYSQFWSSLQNHAGIDFLAPKGSAAFALVDGKVEDSRLDKNNRSSTLVIRSRINGIEYRVLYLHCDSHILRRNGVDLGSLDGTTTAIQAGDEICQTGNVGAGKMVNGVEIGGYHLHLEMKTLPMDSINPLYAISGSHCPSQTFINFLGQSVSGCGYQYIKANTVDPALVTTSRGLTGRINDTGISGFRCYRSGSDGMVDCAGAAARTLNDQQDGMVGRDLVPDQAGTTGFSLTKISSNGLDLPSSATAWSCYRDNVTGIYWQNFLNSNSGSGFTNFGDGRAGDASEYVKNVNASALCGFSDWRVPTSSELIGIINLNDTFRANPFFTLTQSAWSSDASAITTDYIWAVDGFGFVNHFPKSTKFGLRLVR